MIRLIVLVAVFLVSCSHSDTKTETKNVAKEDASEHLWLEDIESAKSLEWVKAQNDKSLAQLTKNDIYLEVKEENHKILTAKDRIPEFQIHNGQIYDVWQDTDHVRGLWRRTSLAEFKKAQPKWEVLLDLDELAKTENQNWVWHFATCLSPEYERCMVTLSLGGKDAFVAREFDMQTKKFVPNGFYLPEAKGNVTWIDKNRLLVATDFGPGTLTNSGYPRQVREWQRGPDLMPDFKTGRVLLEIKKENMETYAMRIETNHGPEILLSDRIDFYNQNLYLMNPDMTLRKLPLPVDSELYELMNGQLVFTNRSAVGKFPAGSLLTVALEATNLDGVQAIFQPTQNKSLGGSLGGRDTFIFSTMEDVNGHLYSAKWSDSKWQVEPITVPKFSSVAMRTSETGFKNDFLYSVSSFLSPDQIFLMQGDHQPVAYKRLPERFNAKGMKVEQFFTKSRDGVKVPYYVIKPKNFKKKTATPTVLYGYGGFEYSSSPYYLATAGKSLIEKGFVFVVANIRGGGEYGPEWHKAATQSTKQRSFDDFIAVAEDLVRHGITDSSHLGIWGGSNGGLLVGAVMTQRPDLFKAVVCERPLLDMLRYHHLLAGNSWVAEYGDPDDAKLRPYIQAYSPYQNVVAGKKYPDTFFYTATKDDRVHPGHARRMAYKMEEQGHRVWFFENSEGGHRGAANQEQQTQKNALIFSFFIEELGAATK